MLAMIHFNFANLKDTVEYYINSFTIDEVLDACDDAI